MLQFSDHTHYSVSDTIAFVDTHENEKEFSAFFVEEIHFIHSKVRNVITCCEIETDYLNCPHVPGQETKCLVTELYHCKRDVVINFKEFQDRIRNGPTEFKTKNFLVILASQNLFLVFHVMAKFKL